MSDAVQSKDLVGRGGLVFFCLFCVCMHLLFGWGFFLPGFFQCYLNLGNTQPFCFG